MRILHLADVHLGMENYGRLHPQSGLSTRVLDFLRCLDEAISYATQEHVDAVIFAGDAYKSREPSPTLQRELARRVRTLSREGIPIYLLVGNHDLPGLPGKADAVDIFATLEVPGVTVGRAPGVACLQTPSGPLQVAGLPSLPRAALLPPEQARPLGQEELSALLVERLVGMLAELAAQVQPGVAAVLTAHLAVEGAVVGSEANLMAGNELLVPVASLAHPAYSYVALGHIHKHQVVSEGPPPVVYSGSIERVDFGEEAEDKGFVVVELEGGQARYRFVPVAARRFLTIRCELGEGDATEQVLAAIAREQVAGAVVRVQVVMEQEQPIDLKAVRAALAEAEWAGPVMREVRRQVTGRSPQLTEQLTDPLQALDEYLAARQLAGSRAQELRRYAAKLLQEMAREESLEYVEQ